MNTPLYSSLSAFVNTQPLRFHMPGHKGKGLPGWENLFSMDFNHHPAVECGIREEECSSLLTDFFQKLRLELRSRPKWKPPT